MGGDGLLTHRHGTLRDGGVTLAEEAGSVADTTGGDGRTDRSEVVVLPRATFEVLVAHLRGSVSADAAVLETLDDALVVGPDDLPR